MGYEVKYIYHPRNEDDGPGYNAEITEERTAKVGKPFDDTPLEKCAAAIMAQLARRDIWVVDVEVCELVKKKISFKESKDGKGIVLKNKRFSLGSTAEMIEEVEELPVMPASAMQMAVPLPSSQPAPQSNLQPHEITGERPEPVHQNTDDLYTNPNKSLVRRSVDPRSIDRAKILYHVYYEPYMHQAEANALKLRFTEDTRYPVHRVIPSPTGRLDTQQIALTDDTGQVVVLDEKFFTSAGKGLYGDEQLDFSGSKGQQGKKRPKLAYEDEMRNVPPPDIPEEYRDIPIEGQVKIDLSVPDIRPK